MSRAKDREGLAKKYKYPHRNNNNLLLKGNMGESNEKEKRKIAPNEKNGIPDGGSTQFG